MKKPFDIWWDSDYDDSTNPYRKNSPIYWAWAGWQAAKSEWGSGVVFPTLGEVDEIAHDHMRMGEFRYRGFYNDLVTLIKEKSR